MAERDQRYCDEKWAGRSCPAATSANAPCRGTGPRATGLVGRGTAATRVLNGVEAQAQRYVHCSCPISSHRTSTSSSSSRKRRGRSGEVLVLVPCAWCESVGRTMIKRTWDGQ